MRSTWKTLLGRVAIAEARPRNQNRENPPLLQKMFCGSPRSHMRSLILPMYTPASFFIWRDVDRYGLQHHVLGNDQSRLQHATERMARFLQNNRVIAGNS